MTQMLWISKEKNVNIFNDKISPKKTSVISKNEVIVNAKFSRYAWPKFLSCYIL